MLIQFLAYFDQFIYTFYLIIDGLIDIFLFDSPSHSFFGLIYLPADRLQTKKKKKKKRQTATKGNQPVNQSTVVIYLPADRLQTIKQTNKQTNKQTTPPPPKKKKKTQTNGNQKQPARQPINQQPPNRNAACHFSYPLHIR